MIQLSDTLQFESDFAPEQVFQKEENFKKFTLRIELFLILLFLFCSACGKSPEQQQAASSQLANLADAKDAATKIENASQQSCGRLTYPKYIDVVSQRYITKEIESGAAHLILHFKVDCTGVDKQTCDSLGQTAIDTFLSQNQGVLQVGNQWPDWAAVSLVVNEPGLRQLQEDCSIEIIEADRKESGQ